MNRFGEEGEFGFFGEPDTAETVEQGWSPPRRWRPSASWAVGGSGSGRLRPAGVAGLSRLAALVAVVIAAVVGLVTGLGGCKGSADNYSRYLQQVRAIAQSSDQAGNQFARALRSTNLTRAGLTGRLQALAANEQQAYDRAEQIRPPGPLRQLHGELLAALELRAGGFAALGQALAGSGGAQKGAAASGDALAARARLLTTSDVVWSALYRTPVAEQLHHRGLTNLAVPDSHIITAPALVSGASLAALLHRLNTPTKAAGPSQTATLKPGDSGPAVASWQKRLNQWLRTQQGQSLLPVDGNYGNLTTSATKALQQAAGITSDGIVGPATRQALTNQLNKTSASG